MLRSSFKRAVLPALLALFFAAQPALAAEPFEIESYKVGISVDKARVHSVREELGLNFTSQSHGIVREIPLSSSQEPYKIENVTASAPAELTGGENVLGIRLGDPSSYVYGPVSYSLGYDLLYEKDGDPNADIVYVTPIGTEWDTRIRSAEVTVTLPTDQIESVEVFRGSYGESRDSGGAEVTGNTVRLKADGLAPHEGLTLYIRLPEGAFTDAPRSLAPVQDALVFAIILLAALVCLLAFLRWQRIGRDPLIVPTVEFYAPDGMNPAELSFVANNSVSTEAVSAMIFFWASKGYIKYVEKEKGGFELERLSPLGSDRPAYEREAFEALFAAGDGTRVTDAQIEKNYFDAANSVKINAAESFRGKRAMEDAKSRASGRRVMLLCLLAPFLYGILAIVNEPYGTGLFGFAGLFPPMLAFALTLAITQGKVRRGAGSVILAVLATALSVGAGLLAARLMETRFFGSVPRCLAIAMLAVFGAMIAALINRRTDYAANIIGRTLGFADFLRTAEKDRLETLVNENPSYFFDTLPYAVVLGVTGVWAKKFDGLIKEPPSWYVCRPGGVFTPYVITANAANAASSLSKVYAQRAVNNAGGFGGRGGFSGGGFSGGGGGGGGGHAW